MDAVGIRRPSGSLSSSPGISRICPVLPRLFALDQKVAVAEYEAEKGLPTLEDLQRAGWVGVSERVVTSRYQIQSFGSSFLVCDWPCAAGNRDYVPGVTNFGRMLAFLTPRRPVDRFLDLGTGSGMHALLATSHVGRVVGTDVGSRAVDLARMGSLLSGVDIDFREGSWFIPVEQEAFDLAAANPPFVISPDVRLLYRDGRAEERDAPEERCAPIIMGLASILAPGGIGVALVSWTRRGADNWSTTPKRWLELAGGVQALLIRYGAWSPKQYAWLWASTSPTPPGETDDEVVDRWLEWYGSRGIEEIFFGAVALRRPASGERCGAGAPVLFASDTPPGSQAGTQLVRYSRDMLGTNAPMTRRSCGRRRGWSRATRSGSVCVTTAESIAERVSFEVSDGTGPAAHLDPRWLPFVLRYRRHEKYRAPRRRLRHRRG